MITFDLKTISPIAKKKLDPQLLAPRITCVSRTKGDQKKEERDGQNLSKYSLHFKSHLLIEGSPLTKCYHTIKS